MTNDVSYVTQEMWDSAQAALRAALPVIEQHTPLLSTAGTMVSLRDQVKAAIVGSVVEPRGNACPSPCFGDEREGIPHIAGCPHQNRQAEPPAPQLSRCTCNALSGPRDCPVHGVHDQLSQNRTCSE